MEYLATGKLVVSTKFPGWRKYEKYISFCESTVKDIQEAVLQAMKDIEKRGVEEYKRNRKFAQNFIWDRQVEAITEFLEDC